MNHEQGGAIQNANRFGIYTPKGQVYRLWQVLLVVLSLGRTSTSCAPPSSKARSWERSISFGISLLPFDNESLGNRLPVFRREISSFVKAEDLAARAML